MGTGRRLNLNPVDSACLRNPLEATRFPHPQPQRAIQHLWYLVSQVRHQYHYLSPAKMPLLLIQQLLVIQQALRQISVAYSQKLVMGLKTKVRPVRSLRQKYRSLVAVHSVPQEDSERPVDLVQQLPVDLVLQLPVESSHLDR